MCCEYAALRLPTVAYDCLEMVTAVCGSLRLPNLAIVYLVAHYIQIEYSVSSASCCE